MFPPFSDRSILLTNLYWDSILYIVQPIFIINPPHAEMMQLCKACKFRSKSIFYSFPIEQCNKHICIHTKDAGGGYGAAYGLRGDELVNFGHKRPSVVAVCPDQTDAENPEDDDKAGDRCAEEAGIVKKSQLVGVRWGVARIQPSQKIMIRIQPRPLSYVLTSVVGTIL